MDQPFDRDRQTVRNAASWFAKLEAEELTEHEAAELAVWLEADPEHAASLARCAAAYDLVARLELPARPAAQPAAESTRGRGAFAPWVGLMRRPAVAWSITAVALLATGASWLRQPPSPAQAQPASDRESPAQRAPTAWAVRFVPSELPAQPVVVLPGQVIVDALSLAVRPFVPADAANAADVRLADDLYRRIAAHVAAIPGFYVPPAEAIAPFSASELAPAEVAAQLGVRAIVDARVSSDGRQVEVQLHLTDASSSTLLLENLYAADVSELDSLQADIVASIGLAMAAPRTEATARINN